jgi:peptidoglycan/xylan/chitin deacetylase (PgdA/CDA1 family)
MKALVLVYHSHHVVGPDYANNDHVALPQDLGLITRCGYRIVPLSTVVKRYAECVAQRDFDSDKERLVALTFDDGPVFDIDDSVHPLYGFQISFLNAMLRFLEQNGSGVQPLMHATSFVIASSTARQIMESNADPEYTYLTEHSLDEAWWNRAIDTTRISIGNHSWDHLHPSLPRVAHSRQVRADFTQVDNELDADAQLFDAAVYISRATRARSSPFFAFPFGQDNPFLVTEYLPRKGRQIGVQAAFTTRPSRLALTDSIWSLPRITCGHHWKEPGALAAMLLD